MYQDFASIEDLESKIQLDSLSDWDVAIRYHDFKHKFSPSTSHLKKRMRKISADAVLSRAYSILGSGVRPSTIRQVTLDQMSPLYGSAELNIENTLEESFLPIVQKEPLEPREIWYDQVSPIRYFIVLCVDTSLSMTGEKLALTAVALAVVLLEFLEDPVGIVAFENEAKVLKSVDEKITITELIERFLDLPSQGYTHLEDGLRAALRLEVGSRQTPQARVASILISDGKYTAGRDPSYLAPRFKHLHVLKMGTDRTSQALCRELARKGEGSLREVKNLDALPMAMVSLTREILRGRS